MRRVLAGLLVMATLATPAFSQEVKKKFGGWDVSIDTDRFNGQSKVIAVLFQDSNFLAVRCFPSGISIVVGEMRLGTGRFEEGMEFEIKFRADKRDIIDSFGAALNDKVVQIAASQEMARQMRTSKEAAFRMTYKGVVMDKVFVLGKNAPKALDEVFKACPEPA